jgi:uncharacterized repeat protein (TIGR01451 family)
MKITSKFVASIGLALVTAALRLPAVEPLGSNVLHQISLLAAEKDARTPAQLKMDSQLIYAMKQAGGQAIAPGLPLLELTVHPDADGKVLVDLTAQVSPALLKAITQMGGTVKSSFEKYNAIRALIPLSQAEALAARADVKFVQGAIPAITHTGSVNSEGDTTHAAITARPFYGLTGAGVKVGVLSDSVDYLAQSQATGDLPQDLVVLPGQSGVPGSGEGTAMLEIVHDLAPGASLYFASAFGGAAGFAQNIRDLRSVGCDIIIDDVFYFNESPFQDGPIAQAVNEVTASGALYFSSAGNEGSVTHGTAGVWEGDFADGGPAGAPVNGKNGNLHSFGAVTYDTITGSGFGIAELFWADPLGASGNDYDLYVVDSTGNTLVSSSTTIQNGTQDPIEFVAGATTGRRLVVVKAAGADRFIHLTTIRGRLALTTTGQIKGHCAATNAFAVAAVDVATSYPNPFLGGAQNPVETFSSDGPRRVFFDANGNAITPGNFSSTGGSLRAKPDIAAADGVATTLPSFSGLNPFFGTSAAAPHAGAVAALLKSYNPNLSQSQVSNIFASTALDIEGAGVDLNSGAGIIMADRVLAATPAGVNLVIVTNYLTGGNGNTLIDANECNDLSLVVQNFGSAGATNIQASITTTNAGVLIAQRTATFPDLPSGQAATNTPVFKISTTPNFQCGSTIYLTIGIKSDQGTKTNVLALASGTNGVPLRFDTFTPVPIPDANLAGAVSPIVVTNVNYPVSHVSVSVYVPHTFDSDLSFELISPDGTRVQLSNNNGGGGDNYGTSCSDGSRTLFDDNAPLAIGSGFPPFLGDYRPETPLSVFLGKTGTNINGTWLFHAVDSVGIDVGSIQCWSLFLTPAVCLDGGSQCPGVDLAIGMRASPEPVVQGSNLVYTITVTNFGPNTAKSTVMSQVLPAGCIFVSAGASQGTISQSGGVVTANFGSLAVNAVATATVTITPINTGVIVSSATVSAADNELDPSNNSATVASHVNPPFCDLAIGLAGAPNPVLVGQTLSYTVSVTNKGPANATGVLLTNTIPAGMTFISAVPSQGVVTSTLGNVVVASLGGVTNGGRATLTINVTPSFEGTFSATSTVSATQVDPFLANNSAIVSTVVGPAADLGIALRARVATLVIGGTNTYFLTVSNRGPSLATGVVLQDILPAGVVLLSPGFSVVSNTVTVALGTMSPGAITNLQLDVRCPSNGTLINAASVSGDQTDSNTGNNTASISTVVTNPVVIFAAANATITAESLTPTNGTIDIGETVTLKLFLRNNGNVPNTNLVATLLATNGVTAPSGPQTYGVVAPGDVVSNSFTFTAAGTNGGVINAVLQLQDASPYLSSNRAVFTFVLPTLATFANTNRIDIPTTAQDQQQPGPASPYPSTINVSGITGLVGKVSVTLSNMSHSFLNDVNVLLVGPSGSKCLVMSHVARDSSLVGATITLDDSAAAPLPASGGITSGAWQPAAYGPAAAVFSNPAPVGPYSATLAALNGPSPNGAWSLYVTDDSGGDFGAIAGGWSLSFASLTPVNQIADLAVVPTTVPPSITVGTGITNVFTVNNAGPNAVGDVLFTSVIPAGSSFVNAYAYGQPLDYSGGIVTGKLGALPSGGSVVVTIAFIPNASGSVSNFASVIAASGETDLNSINNNAVATSTASLPLADLALTSTVSPSSLIVGSNVTVTVNYTNNGPQYALNPAITNPIPAGFIFVTPGFNAAAGFFQLGSNVIAHLPTLPNGASGSYSFVLSATNAGTVTNVSTIYTASIDPQPTNNSASATITAIAPAPVISAAGAVMLAESKLPPNAALEVGETITVSLSLTNSGQLDTTNLLATLVPGNGVTSPSSAVPYGVVVHGGTNVPGVFSFTAAATSNGIVYAVLQLQDGAKNLGTAVFTFTLSASNNYVAGGSISIPDHGSAVPYPAGIIISGATGVVGHVSVTVSGLSHGFPDDLDIMLVSPAGQKIVLMSDAGGGHSVTNVSLTFDDDAAAQLPDGSQILSGTYQPTDLEPGDFFPSPAPAGVRGTALSALNGIDPNGTWNLFVVDDSLGDAGVIAGGWTLALTTVSPVNPTLNLVVSAAASPNPVYTASALTYTITVTNLGPSAASNVLLHDVLPAGFSVSSSSVEGGSSSVGSGSVNFNVPALAANAGFVATIQGSIGTAGLATNLATVASAEVDLEPVSNSAQAVTLVKAPVIAILALAQTSPTQLEITVTAEPLQTYRIESSTDLSAWTLVSVGPASAGGIIKQNINNFGATQAQYYRTVRVP